MCMKIYLREKPLKELQNDAHFSALGKSAGCGMNGKDNSKDTTCQKRATAGGAKGKTEKKKIPMEGLGGAGSSSCSSDDDSLGESCASA